MESLSHKGASIGYEDIGSGPPILFLHCSSASHKEWLFAATALAGRYRCLLPDLMGYGATSSHVDARGELSDCRDLDVAEAMVDIAGEPPLIVAHSYGAATAIELLKLDPDRIRSMLLIEPVSFPLLNTDAHRREWKVVCKLANSVIRAVESGNPRRAADRFMSFWIGRIRWMLSSRQFKDSVTRTMSKVAYEFSLLDELSSTVEPLRCLTLPVTFVRGSRTPAATAALTAILYEAFPRASLVTIEGAGHMSPFTHRRQVLQAVEEHLYVEGRA